MKHTRERVASELRHRLGEIFALRVSDPRLHDVTVVEVRPSADLSTARVFYRVLGDPDEVAGAIERAAPFRAPLPGRGTAHAPGAGARLHARRQPGAGRAHRRPAARGSGRSGRR